MEESRRHGFALPSISSLIIFFILFVVTSSTKVGAYKNYTVGDTLGWYDNTEKSNIDYQKWTAGKTFSLGDFLSDHYSIAKSYGLPKSLKDPSDEAPGPVTPQAGDEESAPDTIVPASFDHPANVTDDSDIEQSGSVPLSVFAGLFGVQLHGILILMGLYCIF
ncbi:hypothetical protein Leryth_000596 [Lithospermum erythrorhizon]|nr:hypothetical protein Leryth_000596 [Lithospermum erythrorhizon]